MRVESFGRIIKLGLTNFWRNRWLSFTATVIMALTLIVISIFAILNIVIVKADQKIKSRMDISVYFKKDAKIEEILDLQNKLRSRSDVREVTYISQEEAKQTFLSKYDGKEIAKTAAEMEENPFPSSLEVKAVTAENLEQIAKYLGNENFSGFVKNISYRDNEKLINRLIGYTSLMKTIGWFFSIVFFLISILVVMNTIRLAIFNRKDEIDIMRLVGASNAFIRVPFVVEGFLYGVIAAFFGAIMIQLGVYLISRMSEKYLEPSASQQIAAFYQAHFITIIGLQLGVGIIVGIVCSLYSIRKHLRT